MKRIYPKFRWYDEDKDQFYFSQDTLFAKKAEGLQIMAPYCLVIEREKQLEKEDLRNISEFTGILDSSPSQIPIYSGDLVQIPNNQLFDDNAFVIVTWIAQFARWNISPFLVAQKQIFVSGNLYQPQFAKMVEEAMKPTQPKRNFEVVGEMPSNGVIDPKKKLVN